MMLVSIGKSKTKNFLKFSLVILLVLTLCYVLLVLALGFIIDSEMPKPERVVETEGVAFSKFPKGVIRYSEQGLGSKAVLFLHGYNGSLEAWSKVWSHLKNCGHAIRVDIPGFGESIWQSSDYDLSAQSRRVREFLDRHGIEHLTLVGVSMGGSLSAKFAADYPDMVDELILISPSGYPGSLRMSGKLAHILEPGTANRIAFSLAKGKLFKLFFPKSTALQALGVTASYGQRWADELGRIRAHTLLVWSPGDTAVPYEYVTRIASQLHDYDIITLEDKVKHNVPENASEEIATIACSANLQVN